MLMAEISAPEAKKAKPKSKEINFSKPISFTNSANAAEFPSLDEASKMKFVSKKEEPKKEAPKKVTEETTSIPMFTNTKKSSDKPSFVELEKLRESSGKGELTSDPYKDKSREFKVAGEEKKYKDKKYPRENREQWGEHWDQDRPRQGGRFKKPPEPKPETKKDKKPAKAGEKVASFTVKAPTKVIKALMRRLRLGPLKHCMNRNFR
eukprot:TRINITY_DN6382_c0_g1_i5.p2 TRINITY_DN6382_c0_g1~~TRINITY_DN6382_c0_g1_i5.p2  ORF type:complete len:207 (-),score=72.51 TRINITY_DN6382_c0_g1_i5:181-801(-)